MSIDTAGGDPNGFSEGPTVSADGRFVAFYSFASDLVPGDNNGVTDVFVRDLQAGTTMRMRAEAQDPAGSRISADGRFVAFHSISGNLVPGDGNGRRDVFVQEIAFPP